MFKKIDWHTTIIWAAIGAVVSSIPAFFYIRSGDYSSSWLLYLGCGLFFFTMALHTVIESKKRGGNESTVALVFAAHVTVVCAIVIACVLALLMLIAFVPGFIDAGNTSKQLVNEPPQSVEDKTGGISFHVFVAATLLNFFGGSIAGVTIPFYAKRNQMKDNKEPSPLQQKKPVINKTISR